MSKVNHYFPAAGQSAVEIDISEVKPAQLSNVWVGRVQLPDTDKERKVVIYQAELPDGTIDKRVVPAACPHQGYDISYDELKADGNVYCTLHKRPICIYSEYNQAFNVVNEGERWYIPKNS